MDDFASAALVTMVRRFLAERGIKLEPPASRPPGAHLPLGAKRALLADVAGRHGLLPLLEAGRGVAAMPADALRTALTRAVDPHDLFSRWSRLERFVHSRHRVLVRAAGDRYVLAEHAGPPATPPTEPESALILGVLAALLESIGAIGLRVTLGHVAEGPCVLDSGRHRSPPADAALSLWRFAWRSFEAQEPPIGRGEEKDRPTEVARRLVSADPARGWTLEALALELASSRRTLQRRLEGAGGFSALVAEVRAAEAARMLVEARCSLAEIGFACGYADQPHFTREFARRTAMTPGRYRTEFAVGTVR